MCIQQSSLALRGKHKHKKTFIWHFNFTLLRLFEQTTLGRRLLSSIFPVETLVVISFSCTNSANLLVIRVQRT